MLTQSSEPFLCSQETKGSEHKDSLIMCTALYSWYKFQVWGCNQESETRHLIVRYFDWLVGMVAEAATTQASRESKRVTRGQPVTPWKIDSDTSHKIWRHPDRYFPYSLV